MNSSVCKIRLNAIFTKHMSKMGERIIRLQLGSNRSLDVFHHVLKKEPHSLLAELGSKSNIIDCRHRDASMIRILVNSLRCSTFEDDEKCVITLPENFHDWRSLIAEACYWKMQRIERSIREASKVTVEKISSTITVAYHGSLTVGRGSPATEVNFRRVQRIIISGKVGECRRIFGSTLNETRESNSEISKYTSRLYLTHTFLEQAFDALSAQGYKLVSSASSTPNLSGGITKNQAYTQKIFLHYSQFVFAKRLH